MKNIRKKALFIIDNVLNKGAFLNEELAIVENSIEDIRDYNLLTQITTGTIQHKLLLENVIKNHSNIKLNKIHTTIYNILLIGTYQILFLDKIPSYSVVDESVKLAKSFGNKGSVGFTNAVLRNISKNKEQIVKSNYYTDSIKNDIERLSILYSHPYEIAKLWYEEYGFDFTKSLLEANNKKPPFTIRVNTLKIGVNELANKLEEKGYIVNKTQISKYALVIGNPQGLMKTNEFNEGLFYIQDEGSILVLEYHDKKADNILDLCAAPGGKSINAKLLNPNARLTSCDISDKKVGLIKSNFSRLGLKNSVIKNDALIYNKNLKNKNDLIIVDAPCSGLGLIRRKPEIKWNRSLEDIKGLSNIQMNILTNAAKYVKINGIIVYSTCTITNEENEYVIEKFLRENSDFEIISTNNKKTLKLYPNIHNTDGFSITRLVKVK